MRKSIIFVFCLFLGMICSMEIKAANGPRNDNLKSYVRLSSDDTYRYITCHNIGMPETIKGFSYDREANTLFLNNATTSDEIDIFAMGDDFSICVSGQNNVGTINVFSNGYGGNLTLKGNGSLVVNKRMDEYQAIRMEEAFCKASLHVCKDIDLTLYGADYSITIDDVVQDKIDDCIQLDNLPEYTSHFETFKSSEETQKSVYGALSDRKYFFHKFLGPNNQVVLGKKYVNNGVSKDKYRLYEIISNPVIGQWAVPILDGNFVNPRDYGYVYKGFDSKNSYSAMEDTVKMNLYTRDDKLYSIIYSTRWYPLYQVYETKYGYFAVQQDDVLSFDIDANDYEQVSSDCRNGQSYFAYDNIVHIGPRKGCEKHDFSEIITPATMTKAGSIKSYCNICHQTPIIDVINKVDDICLYPKKEIYQGAPVKPDVSIRNEADTTYNDSMYEAAYEKDCTSIGLHYVSVRMKKPLYNVAVRRAYQIVPPVTDIKSAKNHKKKITVYWQSFKQNTGYQLQLIKGKKKKTVNLKTTKYTFKKNKKKTKYSFRVRGYKTVKGVKYYADWSQYYALKSKV